MKRMHIHVGVERLDDSIRFYSALFGAQPVKTRDDYAKWMLDDPRINFAISTRAGKAGVDHLGLQVDEDSELEELRARLKNAEMSVFDEGETLCCYARSEKSWVTDPAGIAWEAYRTMEDVQFFAAAAPAGDEKSCAAAGDVRPGQCAPPVASGGCCG
ncbi:MAG: ArsI/CadI family heavy metal resistance metalloenzyme [Halieaceae bacterium]|jgi:catechol 2,3-dioxygenase-like lactoylglutathione lyase family enzyme|nr:ArsI/CadI family heavy metal resistance metalloenzyme [Halieaceae bacterium]